MHDMTWHYITVQYMTWHYITLHYIHTWLICSISNLYTYIYIIYIDIDTLETQDDCLDAHKKSRGSICWVWHRADDAAFVQSDADIVAAFCSPSLEWWLGSEPQMTLQLFKG